MFKYADHGVAATLLRDRQTDTGLMLYAFCYDVASAITRNSNSPIRRRTEHNIALQRRLMSSFH